MLFTIHKPPEMITYDDVWVLVCSHGLIDDPYGFPMESFYGKRKEHPLSLDLGGKNFLHLCGLFVVLVNLCNLAWWVTSECAHILSIFGFKHV